MALFNRTPKKETAKKVAAPVSAAKNAATKIAVAGSHVLISPRVTEKAAIYTDAGVYVFNVTKAATKPSIAAAVNDLFKVMPRKVRIVNIKASSTVTRVTGRRGRTNGSKKAYVYLKAGDKIELA